MSSLFTTPKISAPREDTKAVQRAAAEEAAKRRRAKGFQSTILTSPAGLKTQLGQ